MTSQRTSRLNSAGIISFGSSSISNNTSNNNNNNNNNNVNRIKLLILGAANVGKTVFHKRSGVRECENRDGIMDWKNIDDDDDEKAFVVRLITKRFIGEYDQNKETLYTHRLLPTRERDDVTVIEILDSANNEDDAHLENNIRWADGIVFVYSVSDRKSFEYVERHLALVLRLRSSPLPATTAAAPSGAFAGRRSRTDPHHQEANIAAAAIQTPIPPIVIAANKTDCPPDARRVTIDDGVALTEAVADGRVPPATIILRELSVAESPVGVASLVDDIVRQVGLIRHRQTSPQSPNLPLHQQQQQQIKGYRSAAPGSPSLVSSSPIAAALAQQHQPSSSPPSGSPGADRMSSTLTNVRRVLRDKIYNRSRSDSQMTSGGGAGATGGGATGGGGGLLFGK